LVTFRLPLDGDRAAIEAAGALGREIVERQR
jgi:hypothetical protein